MSKQKPQNIIAFIAAFLIIFIFISLGVETFKHQQAAAKELKDAQHQYALLIKDTYTTNYTETLSIAMTNWCAKASTNTHNYVDGFKIVYNSNKNVWCFIDPKGQFCILEWDTIRDAELATFSHTNWMATLNTNDWKIIP